MCGSEFGQMVTKALKKSKKPFNDFEAGIHVKRTLKLKELDLYLIPVPIRSSTPVPGQEGDIFRDFFSEDEDTINELDGSQEYSTLHAPAAVDSERTQHIAESEMMSSEDEDEDIFRPFLKKREYKRLKELELNSSKGKSDVSKLQKSFCKKCSVGTNTTNNFHKHNITFCNDWVAAHSIMNETPPTFYNNTADMHESLLNFTSVSNRGLQPHQSHTSADANTNPTHMFM